MYSLLMLNRRWLARLLRAFGPGSSTHPSVVVGCPLWNTAALLIVGDVLYGRQKTLKIQQDNEIVLQLGDPKEIFGIDGGDD